MIRWICKKKGDIPQLHDYEKRLSQKNTGGGFFLY